MSDDEVSAMFGPGDVTVTLLDTEEYGVVELKQLSHWKVKGELQTWTVTPGTQCLQPISDAGHTAAGDEGEDFSCGECTVPAFNVASAASTTSPPASAAEPGDWLQEALEEFTNESDAGECGDSSLLPHIEGVLSLGPMESVSGECAFPRV